MCLAVPVKVLEIGEGNKAKVEIDGVKLEVSSAFTPDLKVDDYVIVHAGFILEKIEEKEAKDRIALWAEVQEKAAEQEGPK